MNDNMYIFITWTSETYKSMIDGKLYNFENFNIAGELNSNVISIEFENYIKKFIEFISNEKVLKI